MAAKTYTSTAGNHCIVVTQQTYSAHASGHPSRQQMVPGVTACFTNGKYSTSDATQQTKLDALVTAKQLS